MTSAEVAINCLELIPSLKLTLPPKTSSWETNFFLGTASFQGATFCFWGCFPRRVLFNVINSFLLLNPLPKNRFHHLGFMLQIKRFPWLNCSSQTVDASEIRRTTPLGICESRCSINGPKYFPHVTHTLGRWW